MHPLPSASRDARQLQGFIYCLSFCEWKRRNGSARHGKCFGYIRSSLSVALAGVFAGVGTMTDGSAGSTIHAAITTFAVASTVAALNWAAEKVRDRGRRKTVVEQHNETRAELLAAIKNLKEQIAAK